MNISAYICTQIVVHTEEVISLEIASTYYVVREVKYTCQHVNLYVHAKSWCLTQEKEKK